MQPEFYLPREYPNEPRLRDVPRTPGYWARLAMLGLIRLYQMTLSRSLPGRHVPFLPLVFALRLSGHLLARRLQRLLDERLACSALQSIQSRGLRPGSTGVIVLHMKRLMTVSLVVLAGVLLSACATGSSGASWPGLAADANNAYLANGPFVYAVRLSDGAKVWQYPEKSGKQVFDSNPVATADGQLLVGSSGQDYGLISLDLATGQPKWLAPFTSTDHWVASPLVVGDAVYAPNNNGTLYALDRQTGQLQWSLPLGNLLWGAPVTNGKLLFLTSLDHSLYAVDPAARSVAWKLDLGGSAPGAPAISVDGNTLYIGSFAKKVLAVNAASGSIVWTADIQDRVWGTPALDGDSLYAADMSGGVYSLGAPNGKNAWPQIIPDGPITASPLVLADGVLVATESGSVYAYDRTGVKVWEAIVGGKIYTTPVASGARILVAPLSTDFVLAAVQDGKLLWKFTGK